MIAAIVLCAVAAGAVVALILVSAPNHAATTDEVTFVSLWNPIAARYGLPAYQQDQL